MLLFSFFHNRSFSFKHVQLIFKGEHILKGMGNSWYGILCAVLLTCHVMLDSSTWCAWLEPRAAAVRRAAGPCSPQRVPQNSGFIKRSFLLCLKGFLYPKNLGNSEIKKVNGSIYSMSEERRFLSRQALGVGTDNRALKTIFGIQTYALCLGEFGTGRKGCIIKQSWPKSKCGIPSLPLLPPVFWLRSWKVIG